jgi:CheY-like chemotaxis protein
LLVVDRTRLSQAFLNILLNAAQAIESGDPDGSWIHVEVRAEKDGVAVTITNSGPPIPPDCLPRIFEPFFTTKAPGEGTGLGLSVVHGIMEQHGGAVTLYTHPGRGSRFHLYFPAAGAVEEQSATVAGAGQGRGEMILFVDDDVAVLDTGRKMFERLGYRVSVHIQAETALAEYRAGPAGFDLVFSDLTMPGMSGLQLLAAVRAIRASQPFILCSGIFSESDRQAAARQGVTLLLPKPLNFAALNEALAAVSSRS